MNDASVINIILADDDKDDCLFFKDALDELSLGVSMTQVHDGETLMQHLESLSENLPNALFLDLNMPRKSGLECFNEIRKHRILKNLPVIIYTTSYDERKADFLHSEGAHYYICKPADFDELKDVVHRALMMLARNNLQPIREHFFINKLKTAL